MDMKRLINTFVVACMVVLFTTALVQAETNPETNSTASLFDFDESNMNAQLESATQLEAYLEQHPQTTSAQVNELGFNGIHQGLDSRTFSAGFSMDDMEWGAFAWGFCCWPVGFFTVAINDETTKDEKASYWIGVVVSAVVGGLTAGLGALSN